MTNGGRRTTFRARSARCTPANRRGPLGRQEVTEGTEADRQVEALGEGQRPGVGPHPAGVRVRVARPREHAPACETRPLGRLFTILPELFPVGGKYVSAG